MYYRMDTNDREMMFNTIIGVHIEIRLYNRADEDLNSPVTHYSHCANMSNKLNKKVKI
jgi:hypothetical protein